MGLKGYLSAEKRRERMERSEHKYFEKQAARLKKLNEQRARAEARAKIGELQRQQRMRLMKAKARAPQGTLMRAGSTISSSLSKSARIINKQANKTKSPRRRVKFKKTSYYVKSGGRYVKRTRYAPVPMAYRRVRAPVKKKKRNLVEDYSFITG